jgi:hypothetical protein
LRAARCRLRSVYVLPRRVKLSLIAVQVVSAATLLRSIAYDRWITVLASVLLIVSAMAAQRGRTWGVGMAFATAVWFPVAFAIGIAPAWFCLVGLVCALPFAFSLKPFARFDKGATALLALLSATSGAAIALGWKEIAWTIFREIPSLRPTGHAQHGVAVAATLAVMLAAVASRSRAQSTSEGARVRVSVGERLRVSGGETATLAEALDEDDVTTEAATQRRRSY